MFWKKKNQQQKNQIKKPKTKRTTLPLYYKAIAHHLRARALHHSKFSEQREYK